MNTPNETAGKTLKLSGNMIVLNIKDGECIIDDSNDEPKQSQAAIQLATE